MCDKLSCMHSGICSATSNHINLMPNYGGKRLIKGLLNRFGVLLYLPTMKWCSIIRQFNKVTLAIKPAKVAFRQWM